jgi:putative CocE/NonD family hydrolase
VRAQKDIFVDMADGVGLAVDLYRPDELSEHAAILTLTPYRKDAVFTGEIPLDVDGRPFNGAAAAVTSLGSNPWLAAAAPFVDAGFVVAVADARGTGFSEGVWDYYNLDGGLYDGHQLVEWLAGQPWCTGRVGMMGASGSAIYTYVTALTHPPHLAAISADAHPGDFYHDQWHVGGVFRWANRIGWATAQLSHLQPIDPGDPASDNYERKRAVYEARFHGYGDRVIAGKNPMNLDWLTDLYARNTYDERWQRWSFARRLQELAVPVLHGGVWFDHFGRGTITCHEGITGPKRLIMNPGALTTQPGLSDGGFARTQVAWFEHFLQGADNGVLDEPPVRLFVMGREEYVDEPNWPVPTSDMSLYLAAGASSCRESLNDGALVRNPSDQKESWSAICHTPEAPNRSPRNIFDQRAFERGCLTFTSDPLETELEVIGTCRLILFAATDAPDVDWCVRLCDVDREGRSRLLSVGALKGTHVQSHERPVALEPGKVYRFEIEIWPTANLFRVGHRIRVDVGTSDFPFFASNPHRSRSQVFHDDARRSALVLPQVRRGNPSD